MNKIIITLVFLISIKVLSQDFNEKTRYVVGTFHSHNTTINGLSVGAFPDLGNNKRFVKTNGIRLEIPGIGFLMPLAPVTKFNNTQIISKQFDKSEHPFDEIINGINISTGTVGEIKYNGLTIGVIAQFGTINNGIALALVWNAMDKSNGILVSGMINETLYCNGIQISLSNTSHYMNGIQIGGANYIEGEMIGLQIGLFNKSRKTKGLQIGIWNINEKRKLPIINWDF